MSFVRSLGAAAMLALPFSASCAQRQEAVLEQHVDDVAFIAAISRAESYSSLADKCEIPFIFDSKLPEEEIVRQRLGAERRKYDLYSQAIGAYTEAIRLKETADAVQGRARAYWQRSTKLFSFNDVPLARRDFERVLELTPERTQVHAILGGIHLWRAMHADTVQERENAYVAAYHSFFQARTNHAKHPIADAKLLEYVGEQLKELDSKIPDSKKYQ